MRRRMRAGEDRLAVPFEARDSQLRPCGKTVLNILSAVLALTTAPPQRGGIEQGS